MYAVWTFHYEHHFDKAALRLPLACSPSLSLHLTISLFFSLSLSPSLSPTIRSTSLSLALACIQIAPTRTTSHKARQTHNTFLKFQVLQ